MNCPQFGDPQLPARFWNKVEVRDGGCWIWTGTLVGGYGRIWNKEVGGSVSACRLAYEVLISPIPKGLEIDHLCRATSCVYPVHLEPVTHRENVVRGSGWAGQNAMKTHCPQGHPYDLANTIYEDAGRARRCRACVKARWQREEVLL